MRLRQIETFSFASWSQGAQWAAMLAVSAVFVGVLELFRLPAALLLGPMAAAALLAAASATVQVPARLFFIAQATIGCMISRSITLSLFQELAHRWPLFLVAVISVVVVAAGLGWVQTQLKVLPGSTAIWGSFPGAASAMTLMSEGYGADMRLVAFMQYLRVVLVAAVASIVARLWVGPHAAMAANVVWFPSVDWLFFGLTVAVIGFSAVAGRWTRLPAGPLLLAIALGAALQDIGLLTIVLPPWFLAMNYALLGWSIGVRFTRPILLHAARALPRVTASILALIAICGGIAALLVIFAHIDPLTAYLATSPGGADTVAIIAASSKVDVPFIMAMQTARFLLVALTGPALARFIVAHTNVPPGDAPEPTPVDIEEETLAAPDLEADA